MIVLTLTDCPPSLRGELTRWLLEINTGVYVGRVSARVRDQIWQRVQEYASHGRATMVFSSGKGEQRLDFRTHNSDWEPIDFDGLKLMLRPSTTRVSDRNSKINVELRDGFSKAAKMRTAKRMSKKNNSPHLWEDYVVIDLETTGLSPQRDEVMEIGAVKVQKGKVEATFQALVKINGKIPPSVSQLTGLTDEMLQTKGRLLQEVLTDFLSFVGELPVVAHNGDFDYAFLRTACANHGLPLFSNRRTDTLTLAKRWIEQIPDYKLETLVEHLSIPVNRLHRSLEDCFATMQLYEKLNEIRQNRL
jgi:CRISPR-associated protein Cas2